MKPFCFADGTFLPSQEASVHPSDLGLIRGYGIFDFFRTVNYQPLFLEDYLDRFIASAKKTFIPLPYSKEELRQIIHSLIEKNELQQGGIRMVLSGGISENHFTPGKGKLFMFAEDLFFPAAEKYEKGIKLISLEHVRPLSSVKTTNYSLAVWHSHSWKAQGAEDVLYHFGGYVSESSRSNFFIVKDGEIITPSEHILLGITRKKILELAEIPVQVRPLTLKECMQADEAFITSTTKVLLPVTQLDQQQIGKGVPGPVSLQLTARFRALEKSLVI